MGMEPVIIKKEHPAYIINSLYVPLQLAARSLFLNEIAEPCDIDKVWKIASGSSQGPFESMDMVGLRTVYNISLTRED